MSNPLFEILEFNWLVGNHFLHFAHCKVYILYDVFAFVLVSEYFPFSDKKMEGRIKILA